MGPKGILSEINGNCGHSASLEIFTDIRTIDLCCQSPVDTNSICKNNVERETTHKFMVVELLLVKMHPT